MSNPLEIELHAGHAKKVSGAVGHINEFAENCRVVKRVYEILVASKVPATYYIDEVSSTQSQNINNLVAHHNKDRDGLIVSIHFNAGGDGSKAIGTECIYKTQKSLAEKVAKAISAATGNGLINRGAKYRNDLGVLNGTFEPAVLIEICFVNSSVDVALYKKHFEAICQAIAEELATAVGKSLLPSTDVEEGEETEMKFSSATLKKETESSLDSKAHREIIVQAAVVNGAHVSWLDKLEKGTITDADLLGLSAKTIVAINK